ncbi:DMT family transporter [Pectinatus haikarae]|uniref:Drug/metabolite transporter (DMT)-like permease n=1 Tax=Pectinatus haikarae TaxID=349096 RepID=A0ABT9YAE4_9FIRM|nr:DMT family transporter [Pectinatus haikarae]MDQ0204815.1 drug/metabolite transporter (DMT)-like permease [Pectinatus haikarae]
MTNIGKILPLISATFFWGIQPIALKMLLLQYSTSTIILFRSAAMLLFYFALIKVKNMNLWPALSKKEWSILILMGLTGTTICSISQYEGLRYAPVFHCVLFSAAVPAITAFLARIFLKDQLSLLQWGGILLSFFGVIFMLTKGNIGNIWYESLNIGDLLFFINEVSWSVYIIASRYVLKNLPPLQVTALASFTGIGTFIPYILSIGNLSWTVPNMTSVLSYIFVVIFGGVLAMLAWNKGIELIGVKGAVFNNVTPFTGLIFGNLILGEVISSSDIIGLAAVICGIYILIWQK